MGEHWQLSGLADYALPAPVEVLPLDERDGINNAVRLVRTGVGRFLWKEYLTHADPEIIRAEHRLLGWLAGVGLPFAVPTPLVAHGGNTLVRAPGGAGWRALFPWLPGGRLDRRDPATIGALGQALGELHGALARVPVDLRPPLAVNGDLRRIHPRIPDPFALTPTGLGLPDASPWRERLDEWRATLAALRGFIEGPYDAPPRQVIHGDFGPGNALAEGARITALLDFEFALYDARALDLASGLYMVARTWEWEPPASLAMAEVFCAGYARAGRLTPGEVAALPRLMVLRETVAATWWLGRALAAGNERLMAERLADLRALVGWLARHEAALLDTIGRALA